MLGGPAMAAPPIATEPASTSTIAARTGTRRSSTNATPKSSHSAMVMSGSGRSLPDLSS